MAKAARKGRATKNSADLSAASRAIRDFLAALGLDVADSALESTPDTVARAFHERLLDGYRTSPGEALGRGFPIQKAEPIAAISIPLMLVCPHHLMPASGVGHVAFMPKKRVPGLGRIPRLIDTLSHRLVLQEDLTHAITEALREHFDVQAAVAIIEAQHGCVALEDLARRETTFTTHASFGPEPLVSSLKSMIDANLKRAWQTSSSKRPSAPRDSKSPSRRAPSSPKTGNEPMRSPRRRRSRSDVS